MRMFTFQDGVIVASYNISQQNFTGGIVDTSLDVRDNLKLYRTSALELDNVELGNTGGARVRSGSVINTDYVLPRNSLTIKTSEQKESFETLYVAGVKLDSTTNTYWVVIDILTNLVLVKSVKIYDTGSDDINSVDVIENQITDLNAIKNEVMFSSKGKPTQLKRDEDNNKNWTLKVPVVDSSGNLKTNDFIFNDYTLEEIDDLFNPDSLGVEAGVTGDYAPTATLKLKENLNIEVTGSFNSSWQAYYHNENTQSTATWRFTFTNVNTGIASSFTRTGGGGGGTLFSVTGGGGLNPGVSSTTYLKGSSFTSFEINTDDFNGITSDLQDYTFTATKISETGFKAKHKWYRRSTGATNIEVSLKGVDTNRDGVLETPKVISYYQSRSSIGGLPHKPDVFLMSESNNPDIYTKREEEDRLVDTESSVTDGTTKTTATVKYVKSTAPVVELYADSAVSFRLLGEQTPIIYSIARSSDDLFILTSVGIFSHSGRDDGVINPNKFTFTESLSEPVAENIKPVTIDKSFCFADNVGDLHLSRFAEASQNYDTTNLTRLVDEKIGTISDIRVFNSGNYKKLFATIANYPNKVFVLHLNQQQEVIAWTSYTFDNVNAIDSIEVINGSLTMVCQVNEGDEERRLVYLDNENSTEEVSFTIETMPLRFPEEVRGLKVLEGDKFRIFDVRVNVTNIDNLNVNGYDVPMKLGSNKLGETAERTETRRVQLLGMHEYGRDGVTLKGKSKGGIPAEIKSISAQVSY